MMKKFIYFIMLIILYIPLKTYAKDSKAGLPIPRFVSIRSGEANLRVGPGHHFPAEWTYERARLPIEIIAEYGDWRKVRDYEGTQGWFHRSLLSGRRYVVILKNKLLLKKENSQKSRTIASLQNGLIAELLKCKKGWCHVHVKSAPSVKGWVEKAYIWGVYENE